MSRRFQPTVAPAAPLQATIDDLFDDEDQESKLKSAAADQFLNMNARAATVAPSKPAAAASAAFERQAFAQRTDRDATYFGESEEKPTVTPTKVISYEVNARFSPSAYFKKNNKNDYIELTTKNGGLILGQHNPEDIKDKTLSQHGILEKIVMRDMDLHEANGITPVFVFPTIPAKSREGFAYQVNKSKESPYGVVSMVAPESTATFDRTNDAASLEYQFATAGQKREHFSKMFYALPHEPESAMVQVLYPPAPFIKKFNEHEDVKSGKLQCIITKEQAQTVNQQDLGSYAVINGNEEGGMKYIRNGTAAMKWAANAFGDIHDEHSAPAIVSDTDVFKVHLYAQTPGDYDLVTDRFETKMVGFNTLHRNMGASIDFANTKKLSAEKQAELKASEEAAMSTRYGIKCKLDLYFRLPASVTVPKKQ